MNVCLICVNALQCEYGSVLHFQTIIGAVIACLQISPSPRGQRGLHLTFKPNQFRNLLIKKQHYRALPTIPKTKLTKVYLLRFWSNLRQHFHYCLILSGKGFFLFLNLKERIYISWISASSWLNWKWFVQNPALRYMLDSSDRSELHVGPNSWSGSNRLWLTS